MFEVLRQRIAEFGDRTAIISDDCEYTYSTLAQAVTEKEEQLRAAGIGHGDAVVLIGEFSFAPLVTMLALFFRKATVLPLTRTSHTKLERYISKMGINYLIDTYAMQDVVPSKLQRIPNSNHAWRRIMPADAGVLVVFTSGSTGVPKAIFHNINQLCYRYIEKREPLRSICFLLFDHMGGINTVLAILFRSGTAINIDKRQVDIVCQQIEKHRAHLLPTTPSFLSQLLLSRSYANYDLSSLRVVSYGTEVMSESVLKKLNQVLPGCLFKQTYGLSETGVFRIKSRANDSIWFKFIDKGVAWKIEDNILWIKTKSELLGKILFNVAGFNLVEQKDEWFCTNDVAECNGEYLKILGRQTDIINVGGLKVYPSEVENSISELEFVDDVMVRGKKNLLMGQMVVAYVLLDSTIEKPEANRLIKAHCLDRLERFKVPSQFVYQWDNVVNDRFKKDRTQ